KGLVKTYDAKPLDPGEYKMGDLISVVGGTLFSGDTIEIVSTQGTQTDAGVGSYTVKYRIMHKEGLGKAVDATDWYASILTGAGTLTVNQRILEIKFDPISKK
ncbi:MAG: hypothetical protein IIX86_05765, partial [Clostridia bacterium]|nr:hypothetical protein [Clostridia bacterium]